MVRIGLHALAVAVCCVPPGHAAEPEVLYPRVVLINFDPIIESHGGQRLHVVGGWSDPGWLTGGYISDLEVASHGLLRQRLTLTIDADVYPVKIDGFRYDDDTYLSGDWHFPDGVDYRAIARDYDLARRVDAGEFDEVLLHGAPYFGYWESTMAGRGGYWCNSSPQQRVACSKIFIMMGFNYERGIAEMLHSCGHRSESILTYTYGGWDITKSRHDWERFTHNEFQSGDSACGSVHYPPNGEADYDYANPRFVWATSDDWLYNFPDLTGQTTRVNRAAWGGPDYHRNYMNWWYAHMPHVGGTNQHDGLARLNSWWPYLFDFNRHAESGGDHVPGGSPPPAEPYGQVPVAVSEDAHDDWWPRVNSSGRVVWYGFDGTDFEIYSANADGTDVVQITDNSYSDQAPRINAAGRIVWQAFDGQDYEVFSANQNGTDLVRITDNTTNDWHPQINAAGRIVWDGFDGEDYEIFSAAADGSDVRQLTDNRAASGYPREDVWPQINAGGRVVWFGHDGGDWEIFSANADGSDLVNVSNNAREDEYPRINASGRVVWQSFHDDTNAEIYSADATGGSPVRLSNNNVEDWYPQISDHGYVVWMQRSGADWEIVRALAVGGGLTQISGNETHDQYPQIDAAGRIVWQGFDGQDWEIYAWVGGTVYQVTDNDYDDRAPQLNDAGVIVWHGDGGAGAGAATSEIYAVGGVTGDLDGDGCVDQADLGILLADWGCNADCAADLDGDGDTDQSDLGILLAHWGAGCAQ